MYKDHPHDAYFGSLASHTSSCCQKNIPSIVSSVSTSCELEPAFFFSTQCLVVNGMCTVVLCAKRSPSWRLFRFFGFRCFILLPKEFTLHCDFCLDDLSTGHIGYYLLRQNVDDLVLVDVEYALFLGIECSILNWNFSPILQLSLHFFMFGL